MDYKKTIEQKASIATRWSTITEIATKLITPITNMILARLLTPEAFGVVATVTMVVSFADMFTDAGFQKYLVQHDFTDKSELNKSTNVAFWTNLAISVISYGIIATFSKQIASLVGNPGLELVIIIAALSLPLTSFSSIQMARFKRDFNYKTLFYIRVLSAFIPFAVTVPLAAITHSYWALVIGTLAGNLVNAIILTFKSDWKPYFFYSFSILKSMFSYSWWILLESISIWLTSYIGTFIVGVYLSDYYLGLYKTSMSTVNQITHLVTAATSMPLFAALSRLKNDKNVLFDTYCKYIQAIATVVIPLGVGIFIYQRLITKILLGNQWMEATSFIGLWGLMSSISLVLGTYANGLFNATGKTYLSFWAQVLHLVVLIPVLLWGARSGFEVLYVARSLVRIELVIVELVLLAVGLEFPVIKLFKEIIPCLVCTLIMGVCGFFLLRFSNSLILQLFSIFVCVVIYFASMFLLFKAVLINFMNTFGIKLKKFNNMEI